MVMGTKVEVRTIPLHGLFIHRKQVWRSLGKLRAESYSSGGGGFSSGGGGGGSFGGGGGGGGFR